jgi:hypothetical protein
MLDRKELQRAYAELEADDLDLQAALGLTYGYLLGAGHEAMAAAVAVVLRERFPNSSIDGLLWLVLPDA